jgi:hypothetical protein
VRTLRNDHPLSAPPKLYLLRRRFQFYHGTFQEGKKHGYGVWYTDEGIYSGQIQHDQPAGKGRMDYANGDNLTGSFSVAEGHKESLLGANPYVQNPQRLSRYVLCCPPLPR